jgi:hypothetical protein
VRILLADLGCSRQGDIPTPITPEGLAIASQAEQSTPALKEMSGRAVALESHRLALLVCNCRVLNFLLAGISEVLIVIYFNIALKQNLWK